MQEVLRGHELIVEYAVRGCICGDRVLLTFALDLAHHVQVVNINVTFAYKATRRRMALAALMLRVRASIHLFIFFDVVAVEVVCRREKLGR